MNFYLIANNKKYSKFNLGSLEFNSEDKVVLFNHMYPFFSFDNIKNHPNKIYVSREIASFFEKYNPNYPTSIYPYAGMREIAKYQNYFKKIIFHAHPNYMNTYKKNICLKFIEELKIDHHKICQLEPFSFYIKNQISYTNDKNLSTGLIVYLCLQQIISTNDRIVLVGFSSNLAKKYHDRDWESAFFDNEINNKKCESIIRI